jgi:glutamate carboxypeptidase
VDLRFLRRDEGYDLDAAIRSLRTTLPGASLRVEGGINKLPMEPTEGSRALWRGAQEISSHLGFDLDQATVGGASDGNTVSQHASTLDGLGAVGGGAHAKHEYIEVETLAERAALLASLLLIPA